MIHFRKRGNEPAFPIPEDKDTHEAWKSKATGYRITQVFKDKLTSANYQDSQVVDVRLFKSLGFLVSNKKGAASIHYKVEGCVNGIDWCTCQVETNLDAGAVTPLGSSTAPFLWLRVSVKNNVGQGKVDAWIVGKTP